MSDDDGSDGGADVLLIEDNPGDVRLIEEAFSGGSIACTLHVTGDGIEALDFLHQRGAYETAPRPDLVLLDLNLPGKDGKEVLAEIRDWDDRQIGCLPVIILTGSESQEEVVSTYELRANACLSKPVDPSEFLESLQSLKRFWLSVVRLPSHGEE